MWFPVEHRPSTPATGPVARSGTRKTAASVTVASTLGAPPARCPSRRAPEGSSSTRRGVRSRSPGEPWVASSCQAARITVTESPSGWIRPAHPGTAEAGVQQGPSHRCRAGIPGGPPSDPGGGRVSGDAGTHGAHHRVPVSDAHRQTAISHRCCTFCAGASRPGEDRSDAHHDRFRSSRTTTENRLRGTWARPAVAEVTLSRHRGATACAPRAGGSAPVGTRPSARCST